MCSYLNTQGISTLNMLRDALNRDVNIPIIDEKLEEKVFGTMLDVIAKVMEAAFKDD